MRERTRSPRMLVICTPLLALWSAMPAVLWCPPEPERACATTAPRCETTCPAPERASGSCAMAREREAAATCGEDGSTSDCPMARAGRTAAPTPAPAPTRHRTEDPCGHVCCFGDPTGGAGLLTALPQLRSAPDVVAVLPVVETNPRVIALSALPPQRESRPPPRTWSRRPAARAPPACELTWIVRAGGELFSSRGIPFNS